MNQALTDFFIYSPPKCGTTSLFYMLSQHEELDACTLKEPDFFTHQYKKGIDWYNKLYSGTGLKFESSTNYFSSKKALKNIIESCKNNIKYIIILRHPVDRIISHYKHFRALNIIRSNPEIKNKFESEIDWLDDWNKFAFDGLNFTFDDFINRKKNSIFDKILLDSLYINHVINIHNFVDQKNILYIVYEEFKKDNLSTIDKITNFLNISQINIEPIESNTVKVWEKYAPVSDEINTNIIKSLNFYYKPHSTKLENYLGIKFNWHFD